MESSVAGGAGSSDTKRQAFRSLLGDHRLRVLPDPERRFRVEGLFELALETRDARGDASERLRFR